MRPNSRNQGYSACIFKLVINEHRMKPSFKRLVWARVAVKVLELTVTLTTLCMSQFSSKDVC